MKKNIIIVGSGAQPYRGYIIEEIKKMGLSIILIQVDEQEHWCDQFADHLINAQNQSLEKVITELKILNIPFDGIMCYYEACIEYTAQIAEKLNLSFLNYQDAIACRNKYEMRNRFKKDGLIVPKYQRVSSLEEALNSLEEIGYPAVIKPISGQASIGVTKIETKADFLEIFQMIQCLASEFIIEEYLSGGEVSVESLVYNGDVINVNVTGKILGKEPFFEEIGHYMPVSIEEHLITEILDMTSKGIRALGIKNSAVHSELKLTARGPIIVEVGARLGGDRIPYLVELSTGINMVHEAVKIALAEKPAVIRTQTRPVCIRFINSEKEGYLLQQPNFDFISNWPEVMEHYFDWETGQKVLNPPKSFTTRLGFFITTGETVSHARSIAENCLQKLDLQIKE